MTQVLVFKHSSDEESLEILFGEQSLGNYNHDEDGWHGMERVTKLAEKFAASLKLEIQHVYSDE